MKFLNATLLIFLATTSLAFAKAPSSKKSLRKPNQVEITMIRFKIVYGEKTTLFKVAAAKTGARVDFSNNLGSHATKEISSADYDYLRSEVSNLTEPSNQKVYCSRNFIEITTEMHTSVGCLGAPNRLAHDMQKTVNLISILF